MQNAKKAEVKLENEFPPKNAENPVIHHPAWNIKVLMNKYKRTVLPAGPFNNLALPQKMGGGVFDPFQALW